MSGRIEGKSRAEYRRILAALADEGAQAIILGWTEIGMLVSADDAPVKLFDPTVLHASHAADWARVQ